MSDNKSISEELSIKEPFALTPTEPRPVRRQATGKRKEKWVENQLQECRKNGIASLFRSGPELEVIGKHEKGVAARYIAKAGPDYVGALANGRAIAIEVKSVTPRRLKNGQWGAVRFPLCDIEPHQVRDLVALSKNNALAFVCIVAGLPAVDGSVYLVPIDVVTRAIDRGAPALLSEDLERYKVNKNRLLLDACNVFGSKSG